MQDAVANSGAVFGGIIGIALLVLLILLAIFWLIFPWMVYAQLQGLIQGQKRLEESHSIIQHMLTKMERHNSITATSTAKLAEFFDGRKVVMGADGQETGD